MKIHKSNIPLVAAIQEHVLVSGESHSGLWLGPGVIFKPGEEPRDFHFFFSSTDQKGGDSIRQSFHFTASRLPRSAGDFSQWKKQWETAPYPKACLPRTNKAGYRFVPTFNWKFHRRSGKCLGIGHLLRHRENRLSNHLEHLAITYSVYDPTHGTFTPWESFLIEVGGKKMPCVAYGQRVELPNGDILLPFSAIKELKGRNSIRWCGAARCRFDGKKIQVVEVSNLFTHPVPRGFVEPSIAEHNGQYYMTLRAQDGHSYVTSSANGMNWGKPKPWCWENGDQIAMDQTMTKFISHSDGLFLVYTRITDENTNVFRHRAPLFIAQIDTKGVCLIRKTESTVFSNNGFSVGNFGVLEVSPRETWVTAAEWDRTGREIACNNLLGRIIWRSRNTHLSDL